MKKKSLWKDIFRDIQGSLGRFIAIIGIIAIGVAFFTGLKIAPEDMKLTADKYYDDYNFMDIRVVSTLGLTEDDVEEIKQLEGVEDSRGSYSLDVIAKDGETEIPLRIHDFIDKDQINAPRLIEGRFPEKEDECVIESGNENSLDLEIGSKLKLYSGKKEDLEEDLKNTEFKVVGYIQSPDYLSFEKGSTDVGNGQLRDFIMIAQENFKLDVFTSIYVSAEDTKELNSYKDEYFDQIEPIEDRLESISSAREDIRYNEIYDEAREELEDGRKEYDEAKIKADKELDKAKKEIEDGKKEIADGERELNDGKKEFYTAIADGEKEIGKAEKQLNDGEAEYQNGLSKYNKEKEKAQKGFEEAKVEFKKAEDGMNTLKSNITKIESALKNPELSKDMKNKLENQLKELKATLSNTEMQYRNGKAKLEKNKTEFNKGKELAQREFKNAEAELKNVEDGMATLKTKIKNIEIALTNPEFPEEERTKLEVQLKELKSTFSYTENQYKIGKTQLEKNKVDFNKNEELAKKEFQKAEVELGKAQAGIDTLENNISKLESAINNPQIPEDQKQQLEGQLKELKIMLSNTEKEYKAGKEEVRRGKEELRLGKKQLDDSKKEINDARILLLNAKEELIKEKKKGEIELQDARLELLDARKELQDGEKEYTEEKEKAEKELEKALSEIKKGERELEDLDEAEWHILNRKKHYSYVDYGESADRIDALAKVFPIFFALVAALVTLTTMTRMVDEQRINIGTLKALGYRKKDIVAKYIVYSFTATIFGVILGVAIGYTVFPIIIFNAYALMYAMPSIVLSFNFKLAFIVGLVALVLTTFTSFLASSNELKENPSSLMRPKAPRLGKTVLLERIPFIWDRFNFNYKVTIRNLFRYKRRFFMTVFGIAGSTALILAGFGIRDSIQTVVDKQFGELFSYNMQIGIEDKGVDILDKEKSINEYKLVNSEGGSLTFEDKEKDINIIVPKDVENFDNFINLQNRKGGKSLDLNNGLIITEGMSRELDIEKGDTIKLINSDDQKVDVKIDGIAENYTFNYIYMIADQYEKLFDRPLEYNEALAILKDEYIEDEDSISKEILKNDGITSVNLTSTSRDDLDDTIKSLNYVVILMTVSAGALAFVVLYNLTNINISERIREIATIKVLGFYNNEVSAYIYRENIILTIIGTLTGLAIGIFLHRYIIVTVEMESLMLGLKLHRNSYIYASVLTIVFGVIVNIVMHYKLKAVKMVESLKSVD